MERVWINICQIFSLYMLLIDIEFSMMNMWIIIINNDNCFLRWKLLLWHCTLIKYFFTRGMSHLFMIEEHLEKLLI